VGSDAQQDASQLVAGGASQQKQGGRAWHASERGSLQVQEAAEKAGENKWGSVPEKCEMGKNLR